MCRIAAYLGPPVRLSHLLGGTPHGLVHQSYAPREMTDGLLNADGWGVGWFAPELGPRPGVLKGAGPIWSDRNAATATDAIASGSILAVVRGATPGSGVGVANTPPFAREGRLFAHNGRVWPWAGRVARALRERTDPDEEAALEGTTDSECLVALWLTLLRRDPEPDLAAAVRGLLRIVQKVALAHGGGLSANLVLCEATSILAVRFAHPGPPPSLYLRESAGGADPPGTWLASEPLDDRAGWRAVPPSSLVRADARGARIEPLV